MAHYQPLMRAALAVLVVTAALSYSVFTRAATTPQPELVITGATLIDGTGAPPRTGVTIVVREGRIAAVTADADAVVPEGATVIDAAGKYVIPGLADMHVHFGLGSPLLRQSGTTDEVLARELYYGVTTILQLGATDGSTDTIRSLQARREAGTLAAPYIYGTGGHLTLLGTHPVYTIFPPDVRAVVDSLAAATPPTEPVDLYPLGLGISIVRTDEAARRAVRERAEGGMVAIKITVESGPTTFGDDHPQMSVEMIRAIVDEAAQHDLPVFAHISSLDELEAVLEGGAAGTVHTVWDEPLPDAVLADRMHAAGFMVVPTLALYAGAISLGYIDEPIDLDDPFLRATVSDKEVAALRNPRFLERFRRGRAVSGAGSEQALEIERRMKGVIANVGMLHERGVTIVVGTDTANPYVFPGYSVHQELELLVRSGLTPMEALEAGTRRAAEMIGAGTEFGTVEVGKRADLLILKDSPLEAIRNTRSLELVISDGRVVDRDALLDKSKRPDGK